MTRVDLIKGVKVKHLGLAAMNYRRKFDLLDLEYKIRDIIDYLEMFLDANAYDEGKDLVTIRGVSTNLREDIFSIHDEKRRVGNENCKELFNEVRNKSEQNIEKLLNSIRPF